MPTVTLDSNTHERLRLVAATLGVNESEAVAELLRRLSAVRSDTPNEQSLVQIHVVYKGQRVDAEFDPTTQAVSILTGALGGERFTSPSKAACEVVRTINPSVTPNRNGWGFWLVSATGQVLASIR